MNNELLISIPLILGTIVSQLKGIKNHHICENSASVNFF